MNRSLNKAKSHPNDIKYTPEELAMVCISCIELKPGMRVLDPFMGKGVFYNNYPDFVQKDWCEILPPEGGVSKDFFEYNDRVDWIISNPPFSKLNAILDKCCEICDVGFGLILTCMALTIPRMQRLEKKGFYIKKLFPFQVRAWYGFPSYFVVFEKGSTRVFCHEAMKL